MSDMKQDFDVLKKYKKEESRKRYYENKKILDDSGIEYIDKGTCFLFRHIGKPKSDFYPSSGKWKTYKNGKSLVMYGGAKSFLNWYGKL